MHLQEIHLEATKISDIHKEYQDTIEAGNEFGVKVLGLKSFRRFKKLTHVLIFILLKVLCFNAFFSLWTVCFPHVKLLAVKAVGMKCDACCWFSERRIHTRSNVARRELGTLQALHRTMFMSERRAYHKRIDLAKAKPAEYLSIISDGNYLFILIHLILLSF